MAKKVKKADVAIAAHRDILPKPVWVMLVVLDCFMFVIGFLSAQIITLILSCALAFLIEKFGHETLFAKQEAQMDAVRARVGISHEQQLEVMRELRAQHEKKSKRRAARSFHRHKETA